MELLTPFATEKFNRYMEQKQIERKAEETGREYRMELSAAEKQSKLSPYDTPLNDYMEVVISLGYVVLFSACFPLSLLIFLILIIIEIKVDALKLCLFT